MLLVAFSFEISGRIQVYTAIYCHWVAPLQALSTEGPLQLCKYNFNLGLFMNQVCSIKYGSMLSAWIQKHFDVPSALIHLATLRTGALAHITR